MIRKKLILIGGGGHCHSCIAVIESSSDYEILGILDERLDAFSKVLGYPVLGCDDQIETYANQPGTEFLITVGQIGNGDLRKKLADKVKMYGGKLATIIASTATVSKHTKIDPGTVVMHHVVINAGSIIGENNIINTKALVEHDCMIGDHCHVSTGAILNGNVVLENNCFIGSGSIVIQGLKISSGTFIKAGSLIKQTM